jgi:hypothetical protein
MTETSNGEPAHPEEWSDGYEAGFRDGMDAERARFVDIVHGERGSRGDSCCIGTCDAILDELQRRSEQSQI